MFACREERDCSESYIRHVIENQEMHTGIHEKGLELAHSLEGACLSIICKPVDVYGCSLALTDKGSSPGLFKVPYLRLPAMFSS